MIIRFCFKIERLAWEMCHTFNWWPEPDKAVLWYKWMSSRSLRTRLEMSHFIPWLCHDILCHSVL